MIERKAAKERVYGGSRPVFARPMGQFQDSIIDQQMMIWRSDKNTAWLDFVAAAGETGSHSVSFTKNRWQNGWACPNMQNDKNRRRKIASETRNDSLEGLNAALRGTDGDDWRHGPSLNLLSVNGFAAKKSHARPKTPVRIVSAKVLV
jgi:hypothetical protein